MSTKSTLKEYFGFNEFRPYQEALVEAIIQGRDTVAILPTGSGKSLCYQLPALLVPGTAIVISPLIALMEDQVQGLNKLGIPAAMFNSNTDSETRRDILSNLSKYRLLYVSPERILDPDFMDWLRGEELSFVVIDEAHCISQWGHDFRPQYRQLSVLKSQLKGIPIAAFTATATRQVLGDICDALALQNPKSVVGSVDRPNLNISISQREGGKKQLLDYVKSRDIDESGIIYTATRKQVEQTAEFLNREGIPTLAYHAGMSLKDREKAHHQFINDDKRLIVATVAFGMGINKPDIRFVYHMTMPSNMEQYYQEIGRAGRDGMDAEVRMLFSVQDAMLQKRLTDELSDPVIRQAAQRKTDQMLAFCSSANCRRKELLAYFGEEYPKDNCKHCDNCLSDDDDSKWVDATEIAQKIISCVVRLKSRFGVAYVGDVLYGAKTDTIAKRGHESLPTYGLLSEYSKAEIRRFIYALINMNILRISEGEYPILQLCPAAREVITEGKAIRFQQSIFAKSKKSKKSSKSASADTPHPELLQTLRALRKDLADEHKVPPYLIFHDKTLLACCEHLPQSPEAMLEINGVGPNKLKLYGAPFIKYIQDYVGKTSYNL